MRLPESARCIIVLINNEVSLEAVAIIIYLPPGLFQPRDRRPGSAARGGTSTASGSTSSLAEGSLLLPQAHDVTLGLTGL